VTTVGRAVHPIFVTALLAAAIGGCVLVGGASVGCVAVELEGRPCPCLDGYACTDGVCVAEGAAADGGARSDAGRAGDDDAGAQPDAGFTVDPAECANDDECEPAARCDEVGACVEIACPDDLSLDPEGCDDDVPPDALQLIRVCDDGASFPWELVEELGAANGTCLGAPSEATLVGGDAQGTVAPVDQDFSVDLVLDLDGALDWDVDVPSQCTDDSGCQQPYGDGSCEDAADGCACTGLQTSLSVHDTLQPAGDAFASASGYWRTCLQDGVFLMRRDDGDGLQGPVLLFH
jgi:hypothetical protein